MDREAHPPRRKIRTVKPGEGPERLPWNVTVALGLLAVFVVAATVAGLLAALVSLQAGLAPVGLAGGCLVASLLLGNE